MNVLLRKIRGICNACIPPFVCTEQISGAFIIERYGSCAQGIYGVCVEPVCYMTLNPEFEGYNADVINIKLFQLNINNCNCNEQILYVQ